MAAPIESEGAQRPVWRPVLMALVVVTALGYLGWTLSPTWEATLETLGRMNTLAAALSLLPCVAMYVAKAYYHALIIRQFDAAARTLPVMSAYCQAQVVRYLPGKLWGLLYQAGRLRHHVSPQHVLAANAVQTLNTQLFALGFCLTVVAAELTGSLAWLLLLPAGAAVMVALHRSTWIERLGLRLIGRIWRKHLASPPQPALALSAGVVALLIFDWIVFCACWLLLGGGRIDLWSVVVLAAVYGLSSLLATLAFVVPAGLVLREALFVNLGQRLDFPASELFSLGLVARLVFTAAEVACVPLVGLAARSAREGSMRATP